MYSRSTPVTDQRLGPESERRGLPTTTGKHQCQAKVTAAVRVPAWQRVTSSSASLQVNSSQSLWVQSQCDQFCFTTPLSVEATSREDALGVSVEQQRACSGSSSAVVSPAVLFQQVLSYDDEICIDIMIGQRLQMIYIGEIDQNNSINPGGTIIREIKKTVARSVCLVTLSLSEAGPGRFGRQVSVTDIYHTIPYHTSSGKRSLPRQRA